MKCSNCERLKEKNHELKKLLSDVMHAHNELLKDYQHLIECGVSTIMTGFNPSKN